MGGLGGFFPPLILASVFQANIPVRDRVYGAFRGGVSQLCPCHMDVLAGKNENTHGEKQPEHQLTLGHSQDC